MRYVVPVALAVLACAGWKAQDLRPIVNPPIRDTNLEVQENNAAASLVGQFRTTVSGWLWLRADLYLHNGVEMRPVSEEELKQGIAPEKAKGHKEEGHVHDDSCDHDHEEPEDELHEGQIVTSIPPKHRDFRGIFGDVERQVASFKDMQGHSHNDPDQAMPLYRLMTWLDPQFVPGWTTGGMILARDRSPAGTQRAVAYLQEGWKANPKSVDIPSQIGATIATRKGKLQDAIAYLEKARGAGLKRFRELGEQEREGLRTAYRFLALCYRDIKQPSAERAVLIEAIAAFPDDKIFPKLLSESGR